MKKKKTAPLYARIRHILESARSNVTRSVNTTQVIANWLIGQAGKYLDLINAHALRAQSGFGDHKLDIASRYRLYAPIEAELKAELRRECNRLKPKEGQQ